MGARLNRRALNERVTKQAQNRNIAAIVANAFQQDNAQAPDPQQ